MSTRVAVIGGGPLGLMALKNFREDGLDATLFEGRAWVGGLWKYSNDETLSTAENTIFNTSKYRAAVSDFPVPDDMDDFPTAPQLHRYFESYCDQFELWPHINLNSYVKNMKREGKRWALQMAGPNGVDPRTEHFDKVAFSCGPFVKPRKPDYEGIDQFKGKVLHSIDYHNPSQYKDQNVLVIGIHASGQDTIASLSKYASKAYMSHRSGLTMIPRYTSDGSVYDRNPPLWFTLIMFYAQAIFPAFFTWFLDTMLTSMSRKAYPNIPKSWNFDPAPSSAVCPPLIASELWPRLESGFCEPVPEVRRIVGSRSVELKSDRVLDNIDAIIYCTGYHSMIPVDIEPRELNPYPYPGSPPQLYRHIFPLHNDPAIRNSLAFLGQGAIAFPGFVQHEMIASSVSQIWQGKSSLPSLAEMQKWHRDYMSWREDTSKRYDAKSTFYTVLLPTADFADWLDSQAGLGIRRNFGLLSRWTSSKAWRMWWTDRKLYSLCLSGVTSPAIFRLFDEGKRKAWTGARKQIFMDNERAQKQQERRLQALKKKD